MIPSLPIDCISDGRSMNAKPSRKIDVAHSSRMHGSDCLDSGFSQFGKAGSFAMSMPLLLNRIGSILGICPKKQMIGPHTWRVVAMMTDEQSIRNRTKMKFPRESVSLDGMSIHVEQTVSVVRRCGPKPTAIGPIHMLPESINGRSRAADVGAGIAAKRPSLGAGTELGIGEASAALLTNAFDTARLTSHRKPSFLMPSAGGVFSARRPLACYNTRSSMAIV
jgi:hypothetical protein